MVSSHPSPPVSEHRRAFLPEFCTQSLPEPHLHGPCPGFFVLLWNHERRNLYVFKVGGLLFGTRAERHGVRNPQQLASLLPREAGRGMEQRHGGTEGDCSVAGGSHNTPCMQPLPLDIGAVLGSDGNGQCMLLSLPGIVPTAIRRGRGDHVFWHLQDLLHLPSSHRPSLGGSYGPSRGGWGRWRLPYALHVMKP